GKTQLPEMSNQWLIIILHLVLFRCIWPSFHVALSNGSVFVDFSVKSNNGTIRNMSLSLVNMETNTTLLTRTLPSNQLAGRVEFDCSCFLYAGTFRFLLRQTSIIAVSRANGTGSSSTESTAWWWSSELQVQWPTFHIAVERAGNHSGSFQARQARSQPLHPCSNGIDSALFLEVSYMEYNQIGRNSIDKVRARTRHPIKPLRSQSVELSCAFPFTEKDFIKVALRSPHTSQEVKSSGPLYLSRIFTYKLLVENANAYKSGCEGTMTVKMITPPCASINGKEPSSPPLAYNWLTQGENETEFNCSLFYPGRNKYCFRFVFNFSRSPSPAQTCLLVYRSAESWGPWQPWSVCSVSCGEGVRERVRECLLPSGVRGLQCTGMVKEQSLCSLENCVVSPSPSPSLPPATVGVTPLGGNMVVVVGISLCLAVIMATVVVTVWRKFCQTPQCSSVRRGSLHSPGGRKLSDEASICGHSLQRPSLCDGHGPSGGVGVALKDRPSLENQPLSLVMPLSQDPERLSPTGQKVLPPIFGYRLAQQQLKEMKKKGLKETTQLYHVSSSPVHDTMVETSASPTSSPINTPSGFAHSALPLSLHDDANHSHFCIATPISELPILNSRVTPDRLSPRVELILGPPVSAHATGGSSKWRDRTADWVEMRQPYRSYPIPEHGASEWNKSRPQRNDQRKAWIETAAPTHSNEVKHTGTNTNSNSASEKHTKADFNGTMERQKSGEPGSGIGERAEQNWNRRGPSPIQRNILARKLKEAQSCSGVKGRQRSSTFSVSTSEQRKNRCRSLPLSGDYSSSGGSSYRLSEAEQRMLDLDLSSACVQEEE
uniref:Thrombospondin type 1 domain containing 1 n=1 Tax=Acanthochromis polyacanthus TaxID=80966 RepID=A0A3Q1EJ58_9TELE